MIGKTEFKRIFDTYFDTIRTFIFYRCGNTEVASDMAQDVFMRVWEKREHLAGDSLKALLYKMANDAVISNYRKTAVRADFKQNMMPHGNDVPTPEEEMVFDELASTYAQALENMPEAQRTVFLMSRNDGMKYHEIAEYLGIGVKAVEKRMSAALQYLRTMLLSYN